MKRIILLSILLMALSLVFAQPATTPQPGFEGVQVYSEQQEIEIQIKAMIPDITVVQLKTDTYTKPGLYDYTIHLGIIQDESRQQLINWQNEINNWLEESK